MKYLCLYYSATGNTERAVGLIRRRLESAGSTVAAIRIKTDVAVPDLSGYDAFIVAFPVLAFSPPAFVKRFIRSMPRAGLGGGKLARAYVLAVDGGGGKPAAPRAVRLLQGRGYEVAASACVSYPDNWAQLIQPPDAKRSGEMTREGDAMTDRFADDILSGRRAGVDVGRGSYALSIIVGFLFGVFGRRFLGKTYFADEDCDACGLCGQQCPSRSILLGKGSGARPFWKADCEDCNACINLCPRKAINTSIGRLIIMFAFIVGFAWAGIRAYETYVKTAVGTGLDVVAVSLIIVLAHAAAIGPLDRYLLRFIQRAPLLRRFFAWTFTKNWRRYQAQRI
jgi:Pyruvate/2-oxoacid:ferredoxin oxidoreductase delta subunit